MKYFYLEPEVAGGLGENTILDHSSHPPVVKKLHYQFDGWLGDVLLESFPSFIATSQAIQILNAKGFTGMDSGDVEVTASDEFEEFYPDVRLPAFAWLKPNGLAGKDDLGIAADGRLVVSEQVFDMLKTLGLEHASAEPFDG